MTWREVGNKKIFAGGRFMLRRLEAFQKLELDKRGVVKKQKVVAGVKETIPIKYELFKTC